MSPLAEAMQFSILCCWPAVVGVVVVGFFSLLLMFSSPVVQCEPLCNFQLLAFVCAPAMYMLSLQSQHTHSHTKNTASLFFPLFILAFHLGSSFGFQGEFSNRPDSVGLAHKRTEA